MSINEGLIVTLIGMGIVFTMLIVIAIIIYLFKYINKWEQNQIDKKNKRKQAVTEVPTIEENVVEVQVDDGELVAVISAVIASTLNTTTDKLQVRSIKRVNNSKWTKGSRVGF